MGIISAGATDIGKKRKTNQDSICLSPELNLFVVADGMGGHNGGDIASQLCTKLFPEVLKKTQTTDPRERLLRSLFFVNQAIYQKSEEDPHLKGMGTTVAAAYFEGSQLFVGNVGDSRVYLLNQGGLYQLTKDHTFVQEKLNMGVYTREQAMRDGQKNVLVKSVGFEPEVHADIFSYKVFKDDLFLICSDGLHSKVSDEDIHFILTQDWKKETIDSSLLQKKVQQLIDQANQNGGQDNISVILSYAQ